MNDGIVTTMLNGAKTEMTGGINEALPIAGTVFGVIAGIGIAVKIFKRLTGART